MIRSFGALYAGYIDLEQVGYEGTPVEVRWYPNDRLIEVFDNARAIAQLLERLGYDTFWTAEHHFQREGYECIPNVLLLNVHLAAQTDRLKLGCGFNITPMWHPLRLAEDFAMADILTHGRVIFGVGRGYHTREVETFGAPMLDAEANRELFEEQVEIIFKAFNEESFAHRGTYYTLPPAVPYRGYQLRDLTLVPRPLHRPVEIWQPLVSGSPRGIDFMVRHGIKGIISPTSGPQLHEWMHLYRNTAAHYGQALRLGEQLALSFRLHLAQTVERAVQEARAYFEEQVKFFAPLNIIPLKAEQLQALARPTRDTMALLPRIEESVQQRNWLCGTPGDAIALLKDLEERYPGVERVIVSFAMGTPKAVYLEQLSRFAEEVMPAFCCPAVAPSGSGQSVG
jgi:alkanesulfonate monooxygenase SsuD/methylene tetrahydromethanopterin reductase-like flavin-dependent oxidoreductase (luciferase family)